MLEVIVPIVLAGTTGFSVLISKIHSRVSELDKRIDSFELRVAESYLSKSEFSAALERVEAHMIRIENKLDNLAK